MAKQAAKTAITPTREEDYPEWYQQVVKGADLAENSPVRGCMVIKPWGWGIWENMQRVLDRAFKETGHVNAYFPLFIPLSFFEREAQHVEGFAKECAVVTHHRLEPDGEGGLKPAGPLEEPLVVRPTSETIIGETYAKWVQSYRDLPILINQWANVVRWEMRPRVFLRTAEFLWQEGHTAHATKEEALEETMKMLDVYADFAENVMAVPVIKGEKTPAERFPGAVNTLCIEAVMQDRKALQAGTSHFLGQNFSKASNIQFLNAEGKQEFAWTTSWGVSTRLIGALIMVHSDDDGLVLPPRLAPKHVVLLPIYRDASERSGVLEYVNDLANELRHVPYFDGKIQVEVDDRDIRGGDKVWQHIKKGVPLRVEVGPRDIQSNSVFVGRRDQGPKEKKAVPRDEFVATVAKTLDDIQTSLFNKAAALRESVMHPVDSLVEFEAYFTPKNPDKPEIHGGFALAHWADDPAVEEKLKELKVTARCIPLAGPEEPGKCIFTGKPSNKRVVFAKAY
ncbi:proline--tRNA ligase [bacterium]|nr:proline--tRNA ligase [bacterium]